MCMVSVFYVEAEHAANPASWWWLWWLQGWGVAMEIR